MDKAAEEYVKVTYLYPGSDLTSDAVIRMADTLLQAEEIPGRFEDLSTLPKKLPRT